MTPLERVKIDWSKTKAWSSGGYYARIFMNVQGREPNGIIAPADYERERDELARRLIAIPGPNGEDIGTQGLQARRDLSRRSTTSRPI